MSPKKLQTRPGDVGQARSRRVIAQKYLEVAELIATEDGMSVNVCIALTVLAGMAAGDAICLSATGERYSGPDHAAAADLLARVDSNAGKNLQRLVSFKAASHYGARLLDEDDRRAALRAAADLVREAARRT
ncbi:MAG: hypothetical protein ACFCVG_06475 [Kineosporiaceae bacterium]